ncbi:LysE/ArgO family amino acid transporter [Achromobacter xylosoxidans]|jgi:L-lysine exporter family protein LysE/ArgO|uniref:LysE/ArgO family amino acid transporter n=1 Tax=Alcaligenes xylosoxydans xylosoxydans TaxID=85698 RepID=UPI0001F43D50|nr:LysE/ArgO family amino acid transporter [Achromobacter xylosoxidans]AHC49178.1 Transporter, LysE family [Achromobacter xylosoxidans NBRC 15126 = ATCC 27061]EFV87705.1 arginine exporter protein ArgO [Achromobacter xylosoxidans C54]KOQ21052.1 amino acid transporter [Achromobacter xylosoxidans]KOQ27643.1 amino acid transporter [Achromobacter xylosoxidans]KOQ33696.1 amino acid transporter [Achromobacter xylosoxidans]
MTSAFLPGFFLSLSLILAIGAQNAFVLRQGLRQEHVFAVCLVCAVSDAILIAAGVAGFGLASHALPWLEPVLRYGGALFLLAYAARSLRSALRNHGSLTPSGRQAAGLGATLATCLAFTWLNPHVYLDTVVLLGSISSQYDGHKAAFALGAMAASFTFFFTLGFGARLLRPVFASQTAWRVLDVLVGIAMLAIALKLVWP